VCLQRAVDTGLMGGSGKRAKRESERELERERLVDEAFRHLLTASLEVLCEAVKPGWSSGGNNARRATRLFGTDGWTPAQDMLVEVAKCTRRQGLANAGDALRETIAAYLDGGDPLEKWRNALTANIASTFDNPAIVLSRMLWAASMTASSRWSGDQRQTEEAVLLGKAVIAELRGLERGVDDQWLVAFEQAMTDVGLRPVAGIDPRMIVQLVKCFQNGAMMEMFIDDSLTSRVVADAMVRFAMSFGEPGAINDPRYLRQHDGEYGLMLEGARERYSGAPADTVVGVADLAMQLGADGAAVQRLFPTDADLSDSTLRSLLVTTRRAGTGDIAPAILVGVIERIETLKYSFPALFTDGRTRFATVREETVELVADLLESCSQIGFDVGDLSALDLVGALWDHDGKVDLPAVKTALVRATPRSTRT
jgi:hypothetical protein